MNMKKILIVLLGLAVMGSLPPDRATPVSRGGTGATSLTANNVILGNGTSAVQFVAPGTSGNVLKSNGTTWTSGASSGGGGLFAVSQNLLSNPSWESDDSSWTASGGSYSRTTTAANIIPPGVGAGDWDSNSASQTLTSNSTTITSADGLSGRSLAFSCAIKAASGTATHTIQIYDGTNILSSTTVTSTTSGFSRTTIYAPAPASGTVSGRIVSVASNEPEIYIDDCYLGLAEGLSLSDTSQATLYGSASITACSAAFSRANTAYGDSTSTPTSCSYAVAGNAAAPATNVPGVLFSSLPPGEYLIIYNGLLEETGGAGGGVAAFQITDGTNTSLDECRVDNNANTITTGAGTCSWRMRYTTAQSNVTLKIQFKASAGTANIYGQTSIPGSILVYRYPTTSEVAVRPELTNWFVDANISGANVALSGSSQTSYVELTNGSLTLTNNSGGLTAQIACASGTASTGTTCSSNESIGIAYNQPQAGPVLVCAAFGHNVQTAASATAFVTWQLSETTNTSSAITTNGNDRFSSGFDTNAMNGVFPVQLCSVFNFASAGQKTIRLMYEQSIAGTVSTNQVLADANTSNGQRDIHFTVRPVNQNSPAPFLVGSVTSSSAGAERIERAGVHTSCTSTPCTLTVSTPGVSSITRASTGNYTINFVAGTFSAAPTCWVQPYVGSVASPYGTANALPTSSSWAFIIGRQDTGAAQDAAFGISCMGPK